MTMPVRRESLLPELSDWFESLPLWTGLRPAQVQGIRMEDLVEDNEYVVRAELPGLDPEGDVEITVQRGVLTIRAERREEKSDKTHSEFRYGSFARSVRLPEGAEEDRVKADYKDGILTVRIPFAKPSRETKKVAVSRGE